MASLASSKQYCNVDACRRMALIYGQLVDHDRISPAAHEAMHEFVGLATARPFMQLSSWLKYDSIVAANGSDMYLPKCPMAAEEKVSRQLEGIPMLLVNSSNSQVWRQAAMEKSYNLLRTSLPKQDVRLITFEDRGHLDLIIGRFVHEEVFPSIEPFMREYAQSQQPFASVGVKSGDDATAVALSPVSPMDQSISLSIDAPSPGQDIPTPTSPACSSPPSAIGSNWSVPPPSSPMQSRLRTVYKHTWATTRHPDSLTHHHHPLPDFSQSASLRDDRPNRFSADLDESVISLNMEKVSPNRRTIVTFSDLHLSCVWTTDALCCTRLAPLLAHVTTLLKQDTLLGVVMLGDIFEMWLRPCHEVPPSQDELIQRWKLLPVFESFARMLQACVDQQVRVFFIRGNHDDEMSESFLHKFLPQQVEFVPGALVLRCCYPSAPAQTEREYTIRFEHGHALDLFNVRARNPAMLLHGRTLGYYLTRLGASFRVLELDNWIRASLTRLAHRVPSVSQQVTMGLFEVEFFQRHLLDGIMQGMARGGMSDVKKLHVCLEERPSDGLSLIEGRMVRLADIVEFPLLQRLRAVLLASGFSPQATSQRMWLMVRATLDGDSTFLVQQWMDDEDVVVADLLAGRVQHTSSMRHECDLLVTGHTHVAQLRTVPSSNRPARQLLYCNTGGWIDQVQPTFMTMRIPDPKTRDNGGITVFTTDEKNFTKK